MVSGPQLLFQVAPDFIEPGARLRRIMQDLEAAEMGPWLEGHIGSVVRPAVAGELSPNDDPHSIEFYGGVLIAESCSRRNARFIAAARQDVRYLLDLVREQAFQLGEARRRIDDLIKDGFRSREQLARVQAAAACE